MAPLTPSERTMRARSAAHARWAKTPNRTEATTRQRVAFMAKFEAEVDPDRTLAPEVRARLAENAMRSHMLRLALRSAVSRRKAKAKRAANDAA